uniref:Dolichyl-diphosphooligosaccharide--protein glycosyltransferase subunit 1 n=1 Tax=Glossina palpalis gambiensis TaxID=67801 RepID=A0A1B0BUT1_9MUSC
MDIRIFILFLSNQVIFITSKIINQNVERSIDLTTQVVRETVKITTEDTEGIPFNAYNVVFNEDLAQHVSFVSAKHTSKKLTMRKVSAGSTNVITFPEAAPSHVFYIEVIYTSQIQPYPEEIKQADKQFVRYTGPMYFYSAYKTRFQKTQVKLATSNIISYTQIKPYAVSSNKIKYGPFEDIPDHSKELMTVHYENQTPFMSVNRLERTIQVSHWGNIAVEESIHLLHTGAKLKGSFSRYEFQKDGRSGQASIKSYKTVLPASAFGVYYRDTNGNISTSNMNVLKESVELELRPRFPLFGGWKTQYILGYNLPSFEYLFNSDDDYVLRMRVIDHIFDDMVVDEAVVKIILPEGCASIQLIPPYSIRREADTMSYTYLDTFGRPTIVFSKNNMVENHMSDFELKYKFPKILLLQEPILIITFIFMIFLFTVIFKRLDFSIAVHLHKE